MLGSLDSGRSEGMKCHLFPNLQDSLTGLVSLEPWAALPLCNLR